MTRYIHFDELHDMTISELLVAVTGDVTVASDERWRNLSLGIDISNEAGRTPAIRVSYFPEQGNDPYRIITVETMIHPPRDEKKK